MYSPPAADDCAMTRAPLRYLPAAGLNFVNPSRFHITVYRACNWQMLGVTRGHRRIGRGYNAWCKPQNGCSFECFSESPSGVLLCSPRLIVSRHDQSMTMCIGYKYIESLHESFQEYVSYPRLGQGRKHSLACVLSIAAADLCGVRGYKTIGEWAARLSQTQLAHFCCQHRSRRRSNPA